MTTKTTILIVDDDAALGEWLAAELTDEHREIIVSTTAEAAWPRVEADEVDIVLTDVHLGGADGLALCERISTHRPGIPVVVITAFGSLETAISAIRVGAYDFITKPFEIERMQMVIDRAIEHRRLTEELSRLKSRSSPVEGRGRMVGDSPSMQSLYSLIDRLSRNSATVLVTGESGTGKELVAKALHTQSDRASRPFIALNCAAMPESLLESELFGHTKGAFTGADKTREGLLVQADGGTLFLDEIGELPPGLQAKLLRVIQERKVRPVGGAREIPFDVRLISATHRDLIADVEAGKFREDLYYRLNVVHLSVPPLRERGSDILMLAHHFLSRYADRYGVNVEGISRPAAERLRAYAWPGNVRELENCIERAVALAMHDQIMVEDLPEAVQAGQRSTASARTSSAPALFEGLPPMAEVERRYIQHVLEHVEGHKSKAASILGLDRKTLYRKLNQYAQAETPL